MTKCGCTICFIIQMYQRMMRFLKTWIFIVLYFLNIKVLRLRNHGWCHGCFFHLRYLQMLWSSVSLPLTHSLAHQQVIMIMMNKYARSVPHRRSCSANCADKNRTAPRWWRPQRCQPPWWAGLDSSCCSSSGIRRNKYTRIDLWLWLVKKSLCQ